MASSVKKTSSNYKSKLLSPDSLRIGIVVSEWHPEITEELYRGAEKKLLENGIKKEKIIRKNSPGSFELPLSAQILLKKNQVDAVICLGCIIKGETDHYYFIGNAVSNGMMNVGLSTNIPVAFGVLTTDNVKQANERAGGKYGNKGEEAALAVLKMLELAA